MTLSNPKQYYSRFLSHLNGQLHFAAHSHHLWPDVSRDAHLTYWDDCAKLSDDKWQKIFSEVIPQTQAHIAKILKLKDPSQIVLAPNTHELSARILSLFLGKSSLKILTSSSEFHSWRRQFLRLSELSQVEVKEVSSTPFLTDRRIFIQHLKDELQKNYQLFFLSQVFFDSGLALTDEELLELRTAAPPTTIMVVDGYHAFAALPTNLSQLEGKIFYLGGGYKYAQGGEGVGFMVVPKGEWRPAYTGWFAEYGELAKPSGKNVGYTANALAFMGATQDPSGFYRFNAVWNQFEKEQITVPKIHDYVKNLQLEFIKYLPSAFTSTWKLLPLFLDTLSWHGHFLTFEGVTIENAEDCHRALKSAQIIIDRRGSRLRFGFGTYQNLSDVKDLCSRLEKLAKKSQ